MKPLLNECINTETNVSRRVHLPLITFLEKNTKVKVLCTLNTKRGPAVVAIDRSVKFVFYAEDDYEAFLEKKRFMDYLNSVRKKV